VSRAPHAAAGERTPAAVRHRFFVEVAPAAGEIAVRGDLAHRMTRVLRLPVGARLHLFDGSGRVWPAEIIAVQRQAVQLALGPVEYGEREPPTVLLVGLMRPNRFEWLVEKATELGVTTLRPVIAERGTVRPAEIGAARLERWRRIAVEAAEQCGRLTVPEVAPPVSYAESLTLTSGRLFIAAEPAHGPAASLGSHVQALAEQPVTLLTGPEGGLTPGEVRAAIAAGAPPVSLGSLILRAETAALAALSIVADGRPRKPLATGNG